MTPNVLTDGDTKFQRWYVTIALKASITQKKSDLGLGGAKYFGSIQVLCNFMLI